MLSARLQRANEQRHSLLIATHQCSLYQRLLFSDIDMVTSVVTIRYKVLHGYGQTI